MRPEPWGRVRVGNEWLMTDDRRNKLLRLIDSCSDNTFLQTIHQWDRMRRFDEAFEWLVSQGLTGYNLNKWIHANKYQMRWITSFQQILCEIDGPRNKKPIIAGIDYRT